MWSRSAQSLASSNLGRPRSGGRAYVKVPLCATPCWRWRWRSRARGRRDCPEGPAGFYHAYAGNNTGQLTYSFVGDTQTSLDKITANLGKEWLFLETLYRIYSTVGYNIAHVDVTAQLCAEHNIRYEDVERVEAVVNWLETQYPSPAFPSRREDTTPREGEHAVLHRVRRCQARLPCVAWPGGRLALTTRPRCWN